MSMTEEGTLAALFAKLSVSIDGLTAVYTSREKQLQAEAAKKSEQPSFNQIHGSVILNANGYGVIRFDLPGPNQGYIWNLKTLVVGGSDPTTAVAGRADLYVLSSDVRQSQSLGDIGLNGWRDTTATLPNVSTYGQGEAFCHESEELWVIITGGTAGQQVNAIGIVENVQLSAARQQIAI